MWENLIAYWNAYSVQIIIGIGATAIVALIKPWRDQLLHWAVGGIKWLIAFIGSVPNHLALRNHVLARKPLWDYRKPRAAKLELAPLTVTVMNFKGGVGKTTLAANLAAALSTRHELNVLLIDLDYQGSLTELLKPNTPDASQNNLVSELLGGGKSGGQTSFDDLVVNAVDLPRVKLMTAGYELTDAEDNQMLRWLIHEVGGVDVRHRILKALTRKDWKLNEKFDVVIMDAPPRLSLASANALRASRYVLVPTKLQPLSSLPVAKMLNYLKKFRARIRGSFEIAGVVCSMTNGEAATGTETAALSDIRTALQSGAAAGSRIYRQYVPDLVDVGRPQGVRIGYLLPGAKGDRVRSIFNAIADEFVEQTGLRPTIAQAAE